MNSWYQIRRIRGAVFLILVGVLALLNQSHILSWDKSWPFFLIVAGLLALAERAAWTASVRQQQAAGGQPSPMGAPYGSVAPPSSVSPWSAPTSPAVPPSNDGEKPFIQTHPPAPEDSGREDR